MENKVVKPTKSDKEIVAAFRKNHNDNKKELDEIDGIIENAEKEHVDLSKQAEQEFMARRMNLGALKLRKVELINQVSKDLQTLGE